MLKISNLSELDRRRAALYLVTVCSLMQLIGERMSEGVVTFFKYTHLGFYKVGVDYHEPLSMNAMLSSLHSWFQNRISLADTLLWNDETPGYGNRKKVYLKSIEKNEDTGDYIIILWRAVGSGDGVYGIKADSSLSDSKLYDANDATDGEQVIWGEPAYYWFIPDKNIFASIKFPKSISDTKMMDKFFKDFIELQSTIREKVREVKTNQKSFDYTSVHFESRDGTQSNLWFRIYSKQYLKLTSQADLGEIAKDITHFVKREVISARVAPEQGWTRYFSGLPFISSEVTKDTRKIELTVEASPTAEELKEIFAKYNEDYGFVGDNWTNLGFKKEGVGGVCWLNQFVVKNSLNVSGISQDDHSGHYSAERLFAALFLKRDSLLAPFGPSLVTSDSVERGLVSEG